MPLRTSRVSSMKQSILVNYSSTSVLYSSLWRGQQYKYSRWCENPNWLVSGRCGSEQVEALDARSYLSFFFFHIIFFLSLVLNFYCYLVTRRWLPEDGCSTVSAIRTAFYFKFLQLVALSELFFLIIRICVGYFFFESFAINHADKFCSKWRSHHHACFCSCHSS